MKLRLLARFAAGLLITVGLTLPGQAATVYYVATNGNDANSGTAPANAFRTIGHCASVAVAGDTCDIEGGTYAESVAPAHSGTSSAPITFQPYAGQPVTITGATPITGWTRYQGSIYAANATLAPGYDATENPGDTDLAANQVFTNGAMLP